MAGSGASRTRATTAPLSAIDVSSRLLLVDAFNLIRRIFEARNGGAERIGDVINAAMRSLDRALQTHEPTHAVAVFDSHDRTWRHLLYAPYKATRGPTPPALLAHLDGFREAFGSLQVRSLTIPSYEADDPLATLAVGVAAEGGEARILSTDSMFLQLLTPLVRIFHHFEDREFTVAEVERRYGVSVSQLIDFWAMAGDSSNNIKGVPRIGKKTAAMLLGRYGSLDAILATHDDDAAAMKVRSEHDLVRRCRQLVTLKTDVELGINLKSLRLTIRKGRS